MRREKFLKISETCRVVGLSRYYIDRLIQKGKLEVVKIDNARFVTQESVRRLLTEIEGSDYNG